MKYTDCSKPSRSLGFGNIYTHDAFIQLRGYVVFYTWKAKEDESILLVLSLPALFGFFLSFRALDFESYYAMAKSEIYFVFMDPVF